MLNERSNNVSTLLGTSCILNQFLDDTLLEVLAFVTPTVGNSDEALVDPFYCERLRPSQCEALALFRLKRYVPSISIFVVKGLQSLAVQAAYFLEGFR